MTDENPDAILISRYYRDADTKALAEFVQKHRSWALGSAQRFVSVDDAEDVVQASIIRLMNAEPVGGRVMNPLGWWNTIISATAKDFIRETSRRQSREQIFATNSCVGTAVTPPDDSNKDIVNDVYDEIHRIDRSFRDPLLKRYFEDLSYQEIARELDLRPGTVASRLTRGIERVRAALAARGIYVPPSLSEKANMSTHTVVSNDKSSFVKRWHDTWIVPVYKHPSGIGRLTARVNHKGNVDINFRVDIGVDELIDGDPRQASNRIWFEHELTLTDIDTFAWSAYRTKEGATGNAKVAMQKSGMNYDGDDLLEPSVNKDKLNIRSGEKSNSIDAEPTRPIVPDILVQLIACQLPREISSQVSINLLGFDRNLERRQWHLLGTEIRYAGRSGPPDGLSHTFEITTRGAFGRNMYVWVNDDGSFIGTGDEREGFMAVDDEQAALALIQHGSGSKKK